MPSITYSIQSKCIDQLEEFIQEALRENEEKPAIGHSTVLNLIYGDNVVLL